jgi:hypothetical protein
MGTGIPRRPVARSIFFPSEHPLDRQKSSTEGSGLPATAAAPARIASSPPFHGDGGGRHAWRTTFALHYLGPSSSLPFTAASIPSGEVCGICTRRARNKWWGGEDIDRGMKQGVVRQADVGFVADEALAWLGVGSLAYKSSWATTHREVGERSSHRGRGKSGGEGKEEGWWECALCRGGPRAKTTRCHYTRHTKNLSWFGGVTHWKWAAFSKENNFYPVSCDTWCYNLGPPLALWRRLCRCTEHKGVAASGARAQGQRDGERIGWTKR